MNALTKLIAEAKQAAIHDAKLSKHGEGRSFPIYLRRGDTLIYFAMIGPRGGIRLTREITPGWMLDHPTDFGEPSY